MKFVVTYYTIFIIVFQILSCVQELRIHYGNYTEISCCIFLKVAVAIARTHKLENVPAFILNCFAIIKFQYVLQQ